MESLDQQKMFDTLFLLFLGTLGGFVGGGITSCEIQKIIRDNVFVKQFIFFIIIFSTNSFVQKNSDVLSTFIRSFILFTVFIILMKNNYKSIILSIVLLFINKLLLQHINYTKKNKKKNKKLVSLSKVLTGISGFIIIIGFFEYMREKKSEYGNQFKLITFLLGSNKCKSLL